METITTNTKTVELTGEEVHVHFTAGFPYFWLRNDGSGTVLMSLFPNIEEGKDGVIEVLAGSSAGTMHGFNDTRNDFYISGIGKVQITATHSAHNPFRNAQKGGDGNVLTSDKLVFSLSDIEFTTYNTKVSLGSPSMYNLPLGTVPKTAEIVSKCGTKSNFLFSYGNGSYGETFALTQDEFVGYYNSVVYADLSNIHNKTRHIVCTTENKSISIYVNGVKVVDKELAYPCSPNNYNFSLNSFRNENPINTSDSVLYVLRFYNKRLSEAEIINNYNFFSKKYGIEI